MSNMKYTSQEAHEHDANCSWNTFHVNSIAFQSLHNSKIIEQKIIKNALTEMLIILFLIL